MTDSITQSRPMPECGRWARRLVGVTAMAVALGVVFSAHPAPRTGAPGKGVPTTLQTFTPPPFCSSPLQVQVQGVNVF